MMKKLTSLLLSVVMLVSLLACGASAKTLSAKTLRIAGLKGPTTMGLVHLLSMEKNGTAAMDYDLQLYGAADEIVPKLIKGNLDMAAIPANLAATLYQKTNGGIQVLAVNTLGVLYVVEKGNTVHSFADLKGRTILSTGKGTTPEYVLRYLLTKNGLNPDMGLIEALGKTLGDADLESGVGEIIFTAIGNETDYNYDLNCDIGSIVCGEREFTEIGSEYQIENQSDKTMSIECGVGEVNVQFQAEQ